mmetsp:Transcript_83111/g.144392  ORF Transcript_83111/g.144392 Transcript_83111/m.144392 type:complete len:173 (+) Transcript_83111:80-598(+)
MSGTLIDLVTADDVAAVKEHLVEVQKKGEEFAHREVCSCEFGGGRGARSALHTAATRGRAAMLVHLLATRADANSTDDANTTPLHFAADLGHARAAHVLLKHGANPAARNSFGSRPIDKAVANSWDVPEVVEGKAQFLKMVAGEEIPFEDLRPEPELRDTRPLSPTQRRGGA